MEGTAGKPVVKSWDELMAQLNLSPADAAKTALLLGNGFSIAIYDKFRYKELKKQADQDSLTRQEQTLFSKLNNDDFENVLAIFEAVHEVLGKDTTCNTLFRNAYTKIKGALWAAINKVHPEHNDVVSVLRTLPNYLSKYTNVFTTNYDLLLYWSSFLSAETKLPFSDDFKKGGKFYPRRRQGTKIYYLHGALHLQRDESNAAKKLQRNETQSLKEIAAGNPAPLFICEGASPPKMQQIFQNQYLRHAYQQFEKQAATDHVDILGSSLNDSHLVKPLLAWLKKSAHRQLRISVYCASDADLGNEAQRVHNKLIDIDADLPTDRIHYFNSQTHPIMKAIRSANAQKR